MKNVQYINAGAGSGKTYRLTELLLEKFANNEVSPSEVILTTFTELAAGEFKEKVRTALLETQKMDYNKRIQMSVELDSAAMGTVHNIALNFIQRYWYLLDYGADIQVITAENEKIYLNQSLADVMTHDDYAVINDFTRSFGEEKEDENTSTWQKELMDIVKKMVYYQVTDLEESRKKSKDLVSAIFSGREWTADAVKRYRNLLQKFADFFPDKPDCQKLVRLNTEFSSSYQQFKHLQSNAFKKASKKFVKSLEEDEQADWDSYSDYANSKTYLPVILKYIDTIFNIAERWVTNYSCYKKQNHIINFNDMEMLFLQLLDQPEVQEEIRQRYKLLMVDEFQDSNPMQLKIFNRLSELIAGEGGQSVWVGDPKQAIYGFRGSDTDLILSTTKLFDTPLAKTANLTTDNLKESWRSRQPLVDFVNDIFTRVFTAEEIPHREQIALKAHFDNDLADHPALLHWQVKWENGRKNLTTLGIAMQVVQLLKNPLPVRNKKRDATRTMEYRDIAILAASNAEVANIAAELRKFDIPVSAPESEILQRKEVHLVMTVLQYLLEPYNAHLHADLRYMFEGVTTEQLLNERMAEIYQPEHEEKEEKVSIFTPIDFLRTRVKTLSLPEIVTAVVYELNLPALVCRWGDADIRQQNLNTVLEMAVNYDEICQQMGIGATIIGFLNHLRTTLPEAPSDNTSNTVKVMTYHGSKGLEWPIVILTSLQNAHCDTNSLIKKNYFGVSEQICPAEVDDPFNRKYWIQFMPRFYEGNANVPEVIVDKIAPTPEFLALKTRTTNERKRVLYVGMTRARDYLVLTSGNDKPQLWLEEITPKDLVADNFNLWSHLSSQMLKVVINAEDKGNNPETKNCTTYQQVIKPLERCEYAAKYLSPSQLPMSDTDETTVITITEPICSGIPRSKGTDRAAVGTCIHNIFAAYQPGNAQNVNTARRIISDECLAEELSAAAPEIIAAADHLYAYLMRTYGPAVSINRELPFYHKIEGQVVHGEMDLVWNYEDHGQPRSVLVDYKTFPGNHQQLRAHTLQYVPQLRAYKAALEAAHHPVTACLIYYAVQGSIAEVKI